MRWWPREQLGRSTSPPATIRLPDNGFKVRDEHGGAIAPDGLVEIEHRIPDIEGVKRVALEDALAQGTVDLL